MAYTEYLWIVIVGAIVGFFTAYGIGANEVANVFSTSIGSRALTLRQTVVIAAVCEITGALLLGAGVTKTIEAGIADFSDYENSPELYMFGMLCVLLATGFWMILATYLELPVSATHATVGGVIGMTMVAKGPGSVIWFGTQDDFPFVDGVTAILLAWLFTPLLSAVVAVAIFALLRICVLRRKHSFSLSFVVTPIVYGVSLFFVTSFIIKQSGSTFNWGSISWGKTYIIAAGIGLASVILAVAVVNPLIRRAVRRDMDAQQGESVHGAFSPYNPADGAADPPGVQPIQQSFAEIRQYLEGSITAMGDMDRSNRSGTVTSPGVSQRSGTQAASSLAPQHNAEQWDVEQQYADEEVDHMTDTPTGAREGTRVRRISSGWNTCDLGHEVGEQLHKTTEITEDSETLEHDEHAFELDEHVREWEVQDGGGGNGGGSEAEDVIYVDDQHEGQDYVVHENQLADSADVYGRHKDELEKESCGIGADSDYMYYNRNSEPLRESNSSTVPGLVIVTGHGDSIGNLSTFQDVCQTNARSRKNRFGVKNRFGSFRKGSKSTVQEEYWGPGRDNTNGIDAAVPSGSPYGAQPDQPEAAQRPQSQSQTHPAGRLSRFSRQSMVSADHAQSALNRALKTMKASQSWQALTYGTSVDLYKDLEHDEFIQNLYGKVEQFNKPTETVFKYQQVFTAMAISFAHGSNDVANAVGPFAAIFHIYQTSSMVTEEASVPLWILAMGGLGLVIGLATYGYKVIRAIGFKMTKMTCSRGFAVEWASAAVVTAGSRFSLPLSTAHCIVSSITAVATMEGRNALNWILVLKFIVGWMSTVIWVGLFTAFFTALGIYTPSKNMLSDQQMYAKQTTDLTSLLLNQITATNNAWTQYGMYNETLNSQVQGYNSSLQTYTSDLSSYVEQEFELLKQVVALANFVAMQSGVIFSYNLSNGSSCFGGNSTQQVIDAVLQMQPTP